MKKLLFMALAIALTACHQSNSEQVVGEGSIDINIATRSDVSANNSGTFTIEVPKAEDLSVKITGEGFSKGWSTLAAFIADCNNNLTFQSAPYNIVLAYGNPEGEGYGYENAYYEGSTTVEVPGYGLSVEANIEVVLANSIIAIETTELFDGYFPTSEFSVKGLTYDKANSALLFMQPGSTSVVCKAVSQAGQEVTITKSVELKPTTRHTLQFDLSTAGNLVIEITLDGEIVETIELDIELNE